MRLPRFLLDMLATYLASRPRPVLTGVLVVRDTPNGPQFNTSSDPFDPDALVFTTTTGRAVRHNMFYKRTFKPAVKAALPARLHALRWHDLRHTCASICLAVPGGNLHVVKERLGHDDIRTSAYPTPRP